MSEQIHPHKEKEILQHGFVKRLWVEIFDAEMQRFILSPVDVLDCASCPGGRQEVADEQ